MKVKKVRHEDDPTFGDAHVFVAIERHLRLILKLPIQPEIA
jgi:hypothetical protein